MGVTLGVFMRLEQLTMGETLMEAQTYNALFTLHGVIMIFLFVIPGCPAIFGNFFLPLLIGAQDVVFPAAQPAVLVAVHHWGAPWPLSSLFTGAAPRTPAGRSTCPTAPRPAPT